MRARLFTRVAPTWGVRWLLINTGGGGGRGRPELLTPPLPPCARAGVTSSGPRSPAEARVTPSHAFPFGRQRSEKLPAAAGRNAMIFFLFSLFWRAVIIVSPVPESARVPVFASHPVTRRWEDVFVCVSPLWRGKRARAGRVLKRSQTPGRRWRVSGFRPPFSRSRSVCVHGPGLLHRTALCHRPPPPAGGLRRGAAS